MIHVLEQDGWRPGVQRGSNRQFPHPTKPGRVTVAGKPSQELAPGTLGSILRLSGLAKGAR
jgi:predicted RNA binding protein YcfA (HicA-like mRNA interferase family)